MQTSARRLILATLILGVASSHVTSRAFREYCTTLKIDGELHLTPSEIVSKEPSVGSFYIFDHLSTGLTTVDHFQKKSARETPVRLLYLETDRSQVLDRTVKTIEILRGRFGSVYADKTCFYTRPVEQKWSTVSVHSYFKSAINEIPSEFTSGPEVLLPPLTSLSLVRIFRASPEYLIVAANYEPTGELGSLHIDGAKDGDWLHSSFVPAASEGFVHRIKKDLGSEALKKYGIPDRIDLQAYLRMHRIPLEPVSLRVEITVLNEHYGYDRVIRQDELKDGSSISSRFLQSSFTDEERILNPRCELRFNQQRALGLPTVE